MAEEEREVPDITMCQNDECPLAKKCYRHEAIPSTRQSYSVFMPSDLNYCGFFIEIRNKQKEAT
jgi:hypothetical protein